MTARIWVQRDGSYGTRIRPSVLWWAVLALGLLAIVPVRKTVDAGAADADESGSVLYVSSPETLRRLCLGYDGLLADIYWTRVVQYFGWARLARESRFELLGPLLQITTALDPHLLIAYRFGAIFLAEKPPGGAGRPDAALALLQRGIVANPDYWRLWEDVGFIYYWDLKDYSRAAKAFQAGSERPGADIWMKALAATVAAKGGESETSWLLWSQIYRGAENDSIRRSALDHLAALEASNEMGKLDELLARYNQRMGREATAFREVVESGLLRSEPADPSGVPYAIGRDGRTVLAPESKIDLRLTQ